MVKSEVVPDSSVIIFYAESEVQVLSVIKGETFAPRDTISLSYFTDDPGGEVFLRLLRDNPRKTMALLLTRDDQLSQVKEHYFKQDGDGFLIYHPKYIQWRFMIDLLRKSHPGVVKDLLKIQEEVEMFDLQQKHRPAWSKN